MNRFFSSLLLLLLCSNLQAQQEFLPGTFTIGGNFAHSESEVTNNFRTFKSSQTVLSTSFSYFILSNTELSASIGYVYSKPGIIYKQVTYGIGARYYQPIAERTSIFGGAIFTYIQYLSGVGRAYTGEMGFDFFATSALAIEPGFQYIRTNNYFDKITATRLTIGLRYFFL